MNSTTLEAEYPGDLAWQRLVSTYLPAWEQSVDKSTLLDAVLDEDVAIVLAGYRGEKALSWYSSPCPALDGRAPTEVRKNVRGGLQIIRSVLMRMP